MPRTNLCQKMCLFVKSQNALQVFLVAGVAYGFATAALLVPAIGAFDTLTGRASSLE